MAAKNLHRRKAVALPPAQVTVRDGEIVVVVPDIVGKNASHTGGRGGLRFTSTATKKYRSSVLAGVDAIRLAAHVARPQAPHDQIFAQAVIGAWRLEVVGVWPTENHRVGFVAPNGDCDAAIPQALDALMAAGILDDDARVCEVRAWNLYRKGVRATVIRLVRVAAVCSIDAHLPMGERYSDRNTAIAHLLPLVPPAADPPPPKPRTKAARRKAAAS